tara:strand:+ start:107 stop:886 length:780 start_codon:yes stop_codon:yes gene_type:complete
MKFASWNINSIKMREATLSNWIINNDIDAIAIQEIKCENENFPFENFKKIGFNCEVLGQKSYNGVAILSKYPINVRETKLPNLNEESPQSRYLEVEINDFIFSSIYLPNGNPLNSDKYDYKIKWLNSFISHAKNLLKLEIPIILCGDYNVIPEDMDCWDPRVWKSDALGIDQVRDLFRSFKNDGYYDAFRSKNVNDVKWTFWDYQNGSWSKDHGIRIDHFILSPNAVDKLIDCDIDKEPRGKNKPSDHVPIWCELETIE